MLSGDSFHVVPKPGSRKLVIFFTGTGAGPGVFHYWKVGHEVDAHVVFLNNGSNEWYQYGVPGVGASLVETIATLKGWAQALGADQLYTVGGSMGGHGAALYGLKLGAKVMAFGFESRLMLEASRSAKLTAEGYEPAIPDLLPLMMKATQPIHVYLGEDDAPDLMASIHIAKAPMVHMTTLRGVGHGPPGYLRNRQRLTPLIQAFVDDRPLPGMVEAGEVVSRPAFVRAFHRGYAGYWARDIGRWERGMRRATLHLPSSAEAHFLLGRALHKQQFFTRSMASFAVVLALRPKHKEARLFLGQALRLLGYHHDAITSQKILLGYAPNYGIANRELGLSLIALGRPQEAVKQLKKALSLDAKDRASAAILARLTAREKWTQRLSPAARRADERYSEGRRLMGEGAYREAKAMFEESVALQPNHLGSLRQIGNCLKLSGDPRAALFSHRRVLRIYPEALAIWYDAGVAMLALGLPRESLAYFRKVLALQPDNPRAKEQIRVARRLMSINRPVEGANDDRDANSAA